MAEPIDPALDTSAFEDPTPEEVAHHQRPGEGTPTGAGAPGTTEPQEPSEPEWLKGTGFKTPEELAKAYGALQKQMGHSTKAYKELQDSTKELIRSLAGQIQGKPQQAVSAEDADAFLKQFLVSPKGTLQAALDEPLKSVLNQHLTPLRNELAEYKLDRQIDKFRAEHEADMTAEEQERYLEILTTDESVALIAQHGGDALNAALRVLKAENPTAWAEKERAKKEASEEAKQKGAEGLSAAKAGASGLGGKRTSVHQQNKPKDAFDEVLEKYRSVRSAGR